MKKLTSFHFFATFLFVFACQPLLAQVKVSGQVSDAETGKPLSYVNIGIKEDNIGTISNAEGYFTMTLPEPLLLYDSLTFSALGYWNQSLFIGDLADEDVRVMLQPAPVALPEAATTSGKWKEKTIGVKAASPILHGMATSRQGDILEIAQPIKVKKKPLHLLTARLYLNSSVGNSCTFRVKIYADEEGRPGDLLAVEDVLNTQKAHKGWITAELKDSGLIMDKNFFISFEFIPVPPNAATNLVYGGQIGKGRGYSRSSSLGTWEEAPCSYAIHAQVAVQQ